jgi:anti-sigma factor ChrR (cupin superfamily)
MDGEKIFNLCASVAAGGAHQAKAPTLAVPQRMLSTLRDIAAVGAEECGDNFLEEIAPEIDAKMMSKATEEELYQYLEELSVRFAKEARQRYKSAS